MARTCLDRPCHIERADKPEPVKTLCDRLACAVIDALKNRLAARLHADIIGDTESDKNVFPTRRVRFPCCNQKRHTQHDLRRLRVNFVEISVIIAREIEFSVDSRSAGRRKLRHLQPHSRPALRSGEIESGPRKMRLRGLPQRSPAPPSLTAPRLGSSRRKRATKARVSRRG